MDDLGATLSINLIPDDILPSIPVGKKGKIHGDRRSRVKQRKAARQERETAKANELDPNQLSGKKRKHVDSQPDQATADTVVSHHRDGSKKLKSHNVVISSLFRKNPEIPVITNVKVEAVQENVFTGDAFKDLPLNPYLISNLEEKQGFKQMTEVQKQTIPVLLRGKDALVKSQTGSGKTVAYAVPVVQSLQSRMVKVRREDGPYALVIVPTRELALQSFDLFQKLVRSFVWIVPGCLMGGEKRKAEKSRLRKGINILIATPGRLMDHINTTGVLSLARVRWLVIDEADRLLELGYERDIAQILNALKSQCPDPPQTVLLSATLSQGVERLSSITLVDPERISTSENVSAKSHNASSSTNNAERSETDQSTSDSKTLQSDEENFSLPSQLRQHFVVTPCKQRLVTLTALILQKCKYCVPRSKMIVFLSTQDSVEFHARLLTQVLGSKRDIQKKLSRLAAGVNDGSDSDEDGANMDFDSSDSGGESDDDDNDDGRGGMRDRRRGRLEEEKKRSGRLCVFKLHGDMAQKDRSQTFHDFTQAASGVLLCTDVAARGLDLPQVDWIVQYTSPGATVDYIHRVGRTARAGSQGYSVLFLMPSEVGYVEELNRHKISLTQLDQSTILKCLLDNISDLPKPESNTSGLQAPKTREEAATYLQDRFEECVLTGKDMHGLAAKGFQSFIRAYATYSKEVKDIFKVSDLHLGHVAKSFALREAPAKIHGFAAKFGTQIGRGGNKYKKMKEGAPSKRPLSFKQATLSEYSSGFQQQQTQQSRNKKIMAKPGGKMKAKVKGKKKFPKRR